MFVTSADDPNPDVLLETTTESGQVSIVAQRYISDIINAGDKRILLIDVIGDLLTEINVTSATGIRELEREAGHRVSAALFDAFEAYLGSSG